MVESRDKSSKIGSDLSLCAVPAMQKHDHEVRNCDTFQRKLSGGKYGGTFQCGQESDRYGGEAQNQGLNKKARCFIVSCLWMKFNPVYPSNTRTSEIWEVPVITKPMSKLKMG